MARTSASKTSPTKTDFATTSTANSSLIPKTFTDGHPLPKVLVFDLDYTLWPYWVDTHVTPPLRPHPSAPHTKARDASGDTFTFYPEVPSVLSACAAHNIAVAAASRTHTPDIATRMLEILHVEGADGEQRRAKDFFCNLQIYPANKVKHCGVIKEQTGFGYEEMLFFDDETRNRNVESELGVCFLLVRKGVGRSVVDEGVRLWRRRHGHGGA